MYNESQKLNYIDYCGYKHNDIYQTNLLSIFNKCEKLEEALEKDVSSFTREEIAGLYSRFQYSNEYTYSSVNSRLSSYADWCLGEHLLLDGVNHFREFSLDQFSQYVNVTAEAKKYYTTQEIHQLVKSLPNPRDSFLLLCLFEFGRGPGYAEIFNMKLSDIDKSNKTVRLYDGKVVKVSDLFIHMAEEAYEEDQYYLPCERAKKFAENPYGRIFKSVGVMTDYVNERENAVKNLARIIKNIVDAYGIYPGTNPTYITLSGQFEFIRIRSRELGISKHEYVLEHFDELSAQYYPSPSTSRLYYKKHRMYL